MWHGLQEIMGHKKKTSYITDTDVTLPDKLNPFFARFEDSTVPPSWPLTRTAPLPSLWPT